MKYGVRNSLAGVVAGLAIGAAALFTPQAVLSKNPVSAQTKPAPTPAQVHDFNKEKNKIEQSKISVENTSISKSGLAFPSQTSYSIPGLSVEPATTEALVRRLEHAQVIIQAIDHACDAGRDEHTQLLRQLQAPLNIGAVLIEEFPQTGQDSLTAFCTTGQANMLTEAVAYTSYPRGPNTQYSLMWLLAEARSLGMDLIGIGPDRDQPKYEFMNKPNPDLGLYVDLLNQEALCAIKEQLAIHPGQRIVIQIGAAHVPRLQARLEKEGITSSSLEIWKPVMDLNVKKNSNNWVTALVKKSIAIYTKYIPRLRQLGGDAIINNVSPVSNFVVYSPDAGFSDMDYWQIMPDYFAREIREMESKVGREWMAKKGVMSPDGALLKSPLCP